MDGELCREHAIMITTQLDPKSGIANLIGAIDREITRTAARDPIVGAFAQMVGDMFRPRPPGHAQRPQQQQQRSRSAPRPPSSPPPPPPDPSVQARIVLGFEPTEPLTRDLVEKRKKALARVFHPDVQGGSESHMKRINTAADVLLAKLP